MGVDASAVQIVIDVIDPTSGEAIRNVTGNLDKLGAAGARTGKQIRTGMDEAGLGLAGVEKSFTASEGKLRTMNAEVRSLQGSLFGDTRAATEFLASINGVGAAMELAFPLFGITAFIGVLGIAVQKVQDLYDEHLSLTKAAEDYQQTLEKQKNEDYWKSDSIETTALRIRESTRAAKDFEDAARSASANGWRMIGSGIMGGNTGLIAGGIGLVTGATQNAGDAVTATRSADKLTPEMADEQHQARIRDIEEQHAGDSALRGRQKINAELEKTLAMDREDQQYRTQMNRAQGNPVALDAGESERLQKDRIARREAAAQEANDARETAQQIAHIREQADEAGLSGMAKLEMERKAQYADWVREHGENAQVRADIDRKFYADEKKLADDGAKAIAKDYMEIFKAAHEQAQAFSDRVGRAVEESATQGFSGFAAIGARARKEVQELRDEFNKLSPAQQTASLGQLNTGISAINSGAGQQSAELARRNEEETEQIEAQARAKFLSAEQQKTAAIQEEYRERLEKLQDELTAEEISRNDYNRRVVAAAETRDAEMEESARQAQQKMAGQFTEFFRGIDHPLRELQQLGDKVAGQAAAAMMMRLQTRYGHGTGSGSASSPLSGDYGGIFSKIAGAPHESEMPGVSSHGATSVAMAHFQVESATIAIGGGFSGGAGAGSPAGVRYSGGTYSGGGFGGFGGGGGFGGSGAGLTGGSAGGFSGGGAAGAGMSIGGAGASLYGGTAPGSTLAGSPGIAPPQSNVAGGVVSDLGQGMSLFQQGKSIWGGSGATSAASALGPQTQSLNLGLDGKPTPGSPTGALAGNGSMLGSGMSMGNITGAAGGALGLYSAYEGNGGVGGALSGAMSGMQLGMMVGGPIGAAIGAAGGAIVGAIGMGGREKARVYDLKQVRPHVAEDEQSFETGSLDYLSAYADMQTLDTTAERTTKQWGPAAHSYYNDTIRTEIAQAKAKFSEMAKAGRENYGASAAQFATGTDSVPAMLTPGERIIPTDQNERITRAVESAASAKMNAQPNSQWGGDIHLHAIDAKSSAQWLMGNKHVLRAAINQSYSENSGGADAGF